MANRLGKLQRLVYVPAVAPIPAQDAYCVTTTTTQSYSGFSYSGISFSGIKPAIQPAASVAYTYADSLDADVAGGAYVPNIPAGYSGIEIGNGYNSGYSAYSPTLVTTKTCYLAVVGRAGSPARVDVLDNFAWDAGARSIAPVPDAGFFRAQLPASPIGVQLGFCLRGFTSTYGEMQHSLVARREQYTIVEAGSQVHGPAALPAAALVEVRRVGGIVTYLVNGAAVYESNVPSAGEVYGGALLYSTVDFADSPVIGEQESPIAFAAQLPGLVAAISEDADYSVALLEIAPMQLLATLDAVQGVMQFSAVLPPMRAAISDTASIAWVTADLPAMTLSATLGLLEEIPSSFIGVTPPLVLSANLRSGEALAFSAMLPLAFVAADIADYARVDAELPLRLRMATREPYLPNDTVDGSDAAALIDGHFLETALLLVALDSLDVSGFAELIMVLELSGLDSLDLGDSASLGSIIEMLAIEQVSIMSHAGAARQQALQYAVNYLTGALTTYQDFDFLGFTQHAGQAFAWRQDGLYRLGVENDTVINALVDFGASDYADAHLKRMAVAFVGVRTDGECYLRVAADDGIERVYRLIGEGNQKRAVLAKGVSGRYWNLRLELTDASFATLDNVELEVGVTQRRGFSRRN